MGHYHRAIENLDLGIVEAPRIVDIQNALTYILISKSQPDRKLISAFGKSYHDIAPLSPSEASLVHPVMLDRVAWLVADIVEQVRRDGASSRENLAVRLIRLFSWLSENRDCLTSDLMCDVGPPRTGRSWGGR